MVQAEPNRTDSRETVLRMVSNMNQERLLVNPLLASLGVLAAVKTLNSVARRRLFEHVVVVVGNPTTLTEMPSTWEWIGVSQLMKSGFIFTHSWIKNPSICFQVQIRRVFFVVFFFSSYFCVSFSIPVHEFSHLPHTSLKRRSEHSSSLSFCCIFENVSRH